MNAPVRNLAEADAFAGQPAFEPGFERTLDCVRNARRKGHLKSMIADVPAHQVFGFGDDHRAG